MRQHERGFVPAALQRYDRLSRNIHCVSQFILGDPSFLAQILNPVLQLSTSMYSLFYIFSIVRFTLNVKCILHIHLSFSWGGFMVQGTKFLMR